MKTILKPIVLNEKSYKVNLLHKALQALDLPVSKNEVTQSKAGKDTLKKMRALQAQLNVPVDESTLVDDATSLAIAKALNKRGLTAASRSFTVRGTVRLYNGPLKKRQELIAFDLDLRGVAVYRNIKDIAEIRKNGGFEFLGEAVSDNLGNYVITFYDWQYGQAERKKADVVVYALEEEKIIGRSRMVNSEDYSDKGLVSDLDVIITQEDKRTEYEALMHALNAFLKESKTSLGEIASASTLPQAQNCLQKRKKNSFRTNCFTESGGKTSGSPGRLYIKSRKKSCAGPLQSLWTNGLSASLKKRESQPFFKTYRNVVRSTCWMTKIQTTKIR
jgi:hypothetical protein